jgi:hypothetical protein
MSAGKGDDYRRVDKNKYDKNFEAIFGKKEIEDFQKDNKKDCTETHADVA